MPGKTAAQDTEAIIADIGAGGGGKEPPERGDGGGGGDGDKSGRPWKPPQRRFATAITLGIISILMFFLGMCSAFIVLRHWSGDKWVAVQLPRILWVNTAILLLSSFTLEKARRRLAGLDLAGFRKLWKLTTVLGILFLAGQLVAWLQLVAAGVYIATNQATSFFYIFTVAHAVHLLGGVAALLYVATRDFEKGKISQKTAVEVVSYYWHFMDGLWIILASLLYLGR
jgi:cytochrome c oxidase subunit III